MGSLVHHQLWRAAGCADASGAGHAWSLEHCTGSELKLCPACLFTIIFQITHLLRPGLLQKDAAVSVPDLVLAGHKDIAAFALATTSAAPLVASGGSDNLVRPAAGRCCCGALDCCEPVQVRQAARHSIDESAISRAFGTVSLLAVQQL